MRRLSNFLGMDASRFLNSYCKRADQTSCLIPRNPNSCCISSSAANSTASRPTEFKDLDKVDIVGVFPNYATAYSAWKAKAQRTVDNAEMRYFIVHLHRLLDPESPSPQG